MLAKKNRYQEGLITVFAESVLCHAIIRPGFLGFTPKRRRSNRDTGTPIAVIMAMIFWFTGNIPITVFLKSVIA